jgi:hypothetical protein
VGGAPARVPDLTARAPHPSSLRRSRRAIARIDGGETLASAGAMRRFVLALTAVTCVSSSGCATLLNDPANHVPIVTDPPGARVFVDDIFVGFTPGVIALDRDRSLGRIRVEAPGYAPVMILRARGIHPLFWASLLTFGTIGMLVDVATGAYHDFDETPITLRLVPIATGSPCDGPPGLR